MGRNKTSKGVRYKDATDQELQAEVTRYTGMLSRGLEKMNEYQWALETEDVEGLEPEAAKQAWNRAKKDAETLGAYLTSLKMYLRVR